MRPATLDHDPPHACASHAPPSPARAVGSPALPVRQPPCPSARAGGTRHAHMPHRTGRRTREPLRRRALCGRMMRVRRPRQRAWPAPAHPARARPERERRRALRVADTRMHRGKGNGRADSVAAERSSDGRRGADRGPQSARQLVPGRGRAGGGAPREERAMRALRGPDEAARGRNDASLRNAAQRGPR